MTTVRSLIVAMACIVSLGACEPAKKDIIAKADGIETKAQLEEALGAPDDKTRVGPVETWTYKASDGTVTFLITAGQVTVQTSQDAQTTQ